MNNEPPPNKLWTCNPKYAIIKMVGKVQTLIAPAVHRNNFNGRSQPSDNFWFIFNHSTAKQNSVKFNNLKYISMGLFSLQNRNIVMSQFQGHRSNHDGIIARADTQMYKTYA